jgi:plasmid stability protein
MANLQVKDIDDNLYRALKIRAKSKRRSVSQEVIHLIEEYLNQPEDTRIDSTKQFLSLSWESKKDESAHDIVSRIKKDRRDSSKFKGQKNVFD